MQGSLGVLCPGRAALEHLVLEEHQAEKEHGPPSRHSCPRGGHRAQNVMFPVMWLQQTVVFPLEALQKYLSKAGPGGW